MFKRRKGSRKKETQGRKGSVINQQAARDKSPIVRKGKSNETVTGTSNNQAGFSRAVDASSSSSSSLAVQTERHSIEGTNHKNYMDKQYLDMLNGKDGFGISPSQSSPTRTLVQRTSTMKLVNENLSPTRQAIHKQIGGRIIQENEIKLAHALDENFAL